MKDIKGVPKRIGDILRINEIRMARGIYLTHPATDREVIGGTTYLGGINFPYRDDKQYGLEIKANLPTGKESKREQHKLVFTARLEELPPMRVGSDEELSIRFYRIPCGDWHKVAQWLDDPRTFPMRPIDKHLEPNGSR